MGGSLRERTVTVPPRGVNLTRILDQVPDRLAQPLWVSLDVVF